MGATHRDDRNDNVTIRAATQKGLLFLEADQVARVSGLLDQIPGGVKGAQNSRLAIDLALCHRAALHHQSFTPDAPGRALLFLYAAASSRMRRTASST